MPLETLESCAHCSLFALALYDVPLAVVAQDHDAVIGTVKVYRGLSVNGG